MDIVKASGEVQGFSRQKLFDSLISSGVSPATAEEVVNKVAAEITPGISTKKLFKMAKRLLKQRDSVAGMRYSIKDAIYDLGPSGYPFEKYVARILKGLEYQVTVGEIIDGYCVKHEIDILAKKEKERCMVECKFHQNGGVASDVKIALYVYARFMDVKTAWERSSPAPDMISQGWLVTNTRFSSEALQYANCMGLKVTGWKYPKNGSLERMIENKRMYPVTILPAARRQVLETLLRNDLILARDVMEKTVEQLAAITHLDVKAVTPLKAQADRLCC